MQSINDHLLFHCNTFSQDYLADKEVLKYAYIMHLGDTYVKKSNLTVNSSCLLRHIHHYHNDNLLYTHFSFSNMIDTTSGGLPVVILRPQLHQQHSS